MPVALEMILLFLLFGRSPVSLVPVNGTPEINSEATSLVRTELPKLSNSSEQQISPPSSTAYPAAEVSSPGIATAASSGLPLPGSVLSQEVSTNRKSMALEISNANSTAAISGMNSLGGPPVTMAVSSLETSEGTSGPPVTMAVSSLETSEGTSGPPVTMAVSSLETSEGTSGPPVTMATTSLETSKGTSGPPVTMATRSLKTSIVTSGPPVTIETSSLATSKGTKTSTINISSGSSPNPGQRTNGTLLVAVLVALLVVFVLVALLLLWRHRQKQKTGVLRLSRGGKRNGVVDAWAGQAQVSDEEATTTEGASRGNKDSGAPQGEGSGQRPTLTTFFGRQKSRQGSLALEELKAGPDTKLKAEEEPLVGSEDGTVEASTSDGPEARDVGPLSA
uniref:Sialophorin n=1 Tax=Catagonus wagneri TaxID=51154 RepID=A0A8C3X6L9_9CETA